MQAFGFSKAIGNGQLYRGVEFSQPKPGPGNGQANCSRLGQVFVFLRAATAFQPEGRGLSYNPISGGSE